MRPADALKEKMAEFKAVSQGVPCAACGAGPWGIRSHHTILRQHLPVEYEWDVRGALAVCDPCHEAHHNASRRLSVDVLRPENLELGVEVLGEAAEYYWKRYYAEGSDDA